ncbi:recombinase family protein [Gryllotalpicola reticulitermitis]|uniref:Recombinase family protein n=1 Tax=Gryllotalpicola reticulitermitis TaxID=1184153 RepID=A0ABV8QC25_9MICO
MRKTVAISRPVALYARISSDQTGEGLGVARQLEDCRRLAAERGWVVFDEYVDNDISAFKDKPRPGFERMLRDIEEGRIGAVVAYHQDRLTRRPIEFEQFAEVCQQHGVDQLVTVTSDIGFGNDNGMLIARLTAAVAANESARKSARIRRKVQQNVQLGLPNGGSNRPFGYEMDRMTVRESEAEIIRTVASRFIQGESLRALALWLNEQQVPTSGKAASWHSAALRQILTSGRIAGLREHHGEIAGKAAWEAIITVEQREQILHVAASRKRSGRRAPRRYLLSGMLRCGRCQHVLYSAARKTRNGGEERRYVCVSGPDHGGCGRITVAARPVEEWLTEAALYRLNTPQAEAVLTGQNQVASVRSELTAQLDRAQTRLAELAEMFGSEEITRAEYLAARPVAEKRAQEATRRLNDLAGQDTLEALIGQGAVLASHWETLTLDRQHAIIRAVLTAASIGPGLPGRNGFTPERIVPDWAF